MGGPSQKKKMSCSGVQFPEDEHGVRSTTTPAKKIWAAAFHEVDPMLAEEVMKEPKWRQRYADHLVPLTRKSVDTPELSLKVARDGLKAVYETFDFVRDGESMKLADAMKQFADGPVPKTGHVKSKQTAKVDIRQAMSVEMGKDTYREQALIDLVEQKCKDAEVEPDVVEAIKELSKNGSKWVDSLKDTYFVLFGATSELCPFEKLMDLGLNVIAIARPNAKRQARLIEYCQNAPAGATLTLPILNNDDADEKSLDNPSYLASVSGADIIDYAPEVRNWLLSLYPGKRLVIGSYIYLDGGDHVRASVAMDVVAQECIKERPNACLMYLGTPAVVYPIPMEAHRDSVARRGDAPWWHSVTGTVLGPYQFNVQEPVVMSKINPDAADKTKEISIINGISNVQGPNYMLAKTIQNWRAVVTREVDKRVVSVNMAPTCATDSVMHVSMVARAVRGMKAFPPLTYYEPNTAKHIMALLLIYDMCSPNSFANPSNALRNPMEIFATCGVHGGLWRSPYSAESLGKSAYVMDLLHLV